MGALRVATAELTADGQTDWYIVRGQGGVTISGKGSSFGGGTVSLDKAVIDADFSTPDIWKDENDNDITFTAEFDRWVKGLVPGCIFRLRLNGATAPSLYLAFSGLIEHYKDS